MEEPSRSGNAGGAAGNTTTATITRSGPVGGGRPPFWMGLLWLLALVLVTVAHGGPTGHENAAAGVEAPVIVATDGGNGVSASTPPPPTTATATTTGASGSSGGATGGFKLFESLLGGKGSKASKEAAAAAAAATPASEAASISHTQEKAGEPSAAAAAGAPEQGQRDTIEAIANVAAVEEEKCCPVAEASAAAAAAAAAAAEASATETAGAQEQPTPPPSPPPSPAQQPKQAQFPVEQPAAPASPKPKGPQAEVNYAAEKAGAVVLQSSSSLVGAKNLLDDDKDKYARSPCDQSKWVIINLSEDIRIHALVLANYEKFSSMVKDFQVLYSVQCPSLDGEEDSEGWMELGTFQAREKAGEQRFQVDPPRYARYLKVRLLSHWSREFYCTLSQIKVLGSTLQQGFMDDWQRQKLNLGTQLEAIDPNTVGGEAEDPAAGSSSGSMANQTCLADGTCTTEEGKTAPLTHSADDVEADLLPTSSSCSSDGGNGNEPSTTGEGTGGGSNDATAGTEQSDSQPSAQGEQPTQHEEKGEPQQPHTDKGTTKTFAEPSVLSGRSVDGEGGNGKMPSPSVDESTSVSGGDVVTTEPVVVSGQAPSSHGEEGAGETVSKEAQSTQHPSVEPSNGSGDGNEGGATVGSKQEGEAPKDDGVQTAGEKIPAPMSTDFPSQASTGEAGASTSNPLSSSQDVPTPPSSSGPAASDGTSDGEAGKHDKDKPEKNATADTIPTTTPAAAKDGAPDDVAIATATATPVLIEEGVVTPVPQRSATGETAPLPGVPLMGTPTASTPTTTTTATVVATVSGAPAKTELMTRFRHQCLQQMRLGDFKKQKLAKLQEDLRAKGGGTGTAASSLGSGSPYDNIFKTLMDEMTSLEINQSIFDVYVSNLHSCFVQVVDDVLLEQDRARLEAGETIGLLQGRLQNQATVNEQLLHRMHRLENTFLVGALAWLTVLAFLVVLACMQAVAWKKLRHAGASSGEQEQQQFEKVKQN